MMEYITIPEERLKILRRDSEWKKELLKFLDVNVELKEEIVIDGKNPFQIIRVKEIMKAFGRGFAFEDALDLLDEDYFLESIEVKEFAGKSKRRQIELKGRVIGTEGKTKRMIEECACVKISIYGKTISIIGKWDNMIIAKEAIEMILSGSKHNTVYRFLKNQKMV